MLAEHERKTCLNCARGKFKDDNNILRIVISKQIKLILDISIRKRFILWKTLKP